MMKVFILKTKRSFLLSRSFFVITLLMCNLLHAQANPIYAASHKNQHQHYDTKALYFSSNDIAKATSTINISNSESTVQITFMLDMSNESDFVNIGIRGSWDEWSNTHKLTAIGNNIFEIQLILQTNSLLEFKFVKLDINDQITEWEYLADRCATGQYNNRYLTVPSINSLLDMFFFNTCPTYSLTDDDVVVVDGSIESCSYDFELKDIIIPETLDNQTVTAIGDGSWNTAPFANKGIHSIQLPSTLKNIGSFAFVGNFLDNLHIPDGVETIGERTFGSNYMSSVYIPNSVNSIGPFAFSGNNLTNISLPENLQEISSYSFSNNALQSVTIPSSVVSIKGWAFTGNQLRSIDIPGNVTSIERSAFENNNLESVTIPNSVTSLGSMVFNNNSITQVNGAASTGIIFGRNSDGSDDLTTIVSYGGTATNIDFIPGTVESIGTLAFSNNSLVNVSIPDNVNYIGRSAFQSNSISNVNIADQISYLGDGAFNNNSIVQVNGEVSNGIFYARIEDGSIDYSTIVSYGGMADEIDFIPEGVVTIGYASFERNGLTSVEIPASVKDIQGIAFLYNQLTNLTIPKNVVSIGSSSFNNNQLANVVFESNSYIQSIGSRAFDYNTDLNTITLPTNVNSNFSAYEDGEGNIYNPGDNISNFTTNYWAVIPYTISLNDVLFENGIIKEYYGVNKDIIIPESFMIEGVEQSVVAIGERAFSNKFLERISLPEGLLTIGASAFERNSLKQVVIPNSVTDIEIGAFSRNSISSALISNNLTTIGAWSFSSNKLTELNIPSTIKTIENGAFFSNSLETVIIPGTVSTIGSSAFRSNKLSTLTIENGTKTIDSYAFLDNYLTDINIPTSVTQIGNAAFNKNAITILNGEMSNGLIYARNNDGSNDESVIISYGGNNSVVDFIEQGVTTIGAFSFYDTEITSLNLPNSITTIEVSAFRVNELSNVVIPDAVTNIESFAFASNNIESVVIPGSVTNIGNAAFNNNAITQLNNSPSNGIILARNPDGSEDESIIVSYGGSAKSIDFIPNTVKRINASAFSGNSIIDLVLPNELMVIEKYAFDGNALSSINLPSTINTIAEFAFGYNQLTSVTFDQNSHIQVIEKNAFIDNPDLTLVQLPSNNNTGFLGYKDSNGTTYSENEDITDFSLTYYAMLPPHTLTIEDVQFENGTIINYLSNYHNIIIPESFNVDGMNIAISTIKNLAFAYKSLSDVTLSNRIETIESHAFSGNDIQSISLPTPVLKEGYSFLEWQDANENPVTEIADFYEEYKAQFFLTGHIITGRIIINPIETSTINRLKIANLDNMEDVSLYISGDISAIKQVNSDGTYSFALNSGRSIVITPYKPGYSFNPSTIEINNIQDDIDNLDFAPIVTSIKDEDYSNIKIYPNPTTGLIKIDSEIEISSIEIYNQMGQLVSSNLKTQSIDISHLTEGIYIIKLTNRKGTIKTYKINKK